MVHFNFSDYAQAAAGAARRGGGGLRAEGGDPDIQEIRIMHNTTASWPYLSTLQSASLPSTRSLTAYKVNAHIGAMIHDGMCSSR